MNEAGNTDYVKLAAALLACWDEFNEIMSDALHEQVKSALGLREFIALAESGGGAIPPTDSVKSEDDADRGTVAVLRAKVKMYEAWLRENAPTCPLLVENIVDAEGDGERLRAHGQCATFLVVDVSDE